MATTLPKSIVFITGAFLGNNCWDEWKVYYESKGFFCMAPAWPHKDPSPEELRNRHPDAGVASNRLSRLVEYFVGIISDLPEKPILIGHSLGGLIVQLLLQRRVGAAGVALHSFPPLGTGKYLFYFFAAWRGEMGWFTSRQKTYMIPFRRWKVAVANGMTCEQQKELFYKYATPESKMIVRDGFSCMAKVDFEKPHAPLLLVSGGRDKIISASVNYRNYLEYKSKGSITDYREFRNHNHLIFDMPAWKEDADFVLFWLEGIN